MNKKSVDTESTKKNRLVSNISEISLLVLALCAIVAISYGYWRFERLWHYNTSYRSMVQEQIDASTKPLQRQIDELKAHR